MNYPALNDQVSCLIDSLFGDASSRFCFTSESVLDTDKITPENNTWLSCHDMYRVEEVGKVEKIKKNEEKV